MQRYAVAYVAAIVENKSVRVQDLAAEIRVSRFTVAEWRNQTPGFNEWIGSMLNRHVAHMWPAVKAVCVRLALQGSIRHMRLLRELMEPAIRQHGGGDAPTPAGASIFAGAVIVNVPQPPAELEGHAAVRGLLEQVPVIEATAVQAGGA